VRVFLTANRHLLSNAKFLDLPPRLWVFQLIGAVNQPVSSETGIKAVCVVLGKKCSWKKKYESNQIRHNGNPVFALM